jgi:NAD(P)-dependent dehydrogenase (short-subunit alcohol dehydrogenase family)
MGTISGAGSAIVIGAGPGIGAAVARKLAQEGLAVGVIARSRTTLDDTLAAVAPGTALALTADVTDEAALRTALDRLVERNGVPAVLVYNAALVRRDALGELSARQQLDAYAVNVVGAITAVAHLAPRMAEAGSGTILLTGGISDPIPEATSLSLGKAGVRALTSLLAKAYGPSGIHVATVTVAGGVSPGSAFDPDEIAERYWQIHLQPASEWEQEVLYLGPAG